MNTRTNHGAIVPIERIKSTFTLPTPPPGMKWHRENGWKAEMLPPGMRPLVSWEARQAGDKVFSRVHHYQEWAAADGLIGYMAASEDCKEHFICTTRPLLFTHEGHEWTWHKPGDPMPCDGDSEVHILCLDGVERPCCVTAYNARWDKMNNADIIGWRYADTEQPDDSPLDDITAYRVLKWREKKPKVPLGKDDIPPGSVFMFVPGVWIAPLCVSQDGIGLPETEAGKPLIQKWSFEFLQECARINRSIPMSGKWNPEAWEPCEK